MNLTTENVRDLRNLIQSNGFCTNQCQYCSLTDAYEISIPKGLLRLETIQLCTFLSMGSVYGDNFFHPHRKERAKQLLVDANQTEALMEIYL